MSAWRRFERATGLVVHTWRGNSRFVRNPDLFIGRVGPFALGRLGGAARGFSVSAWNRWLLLGHITERENPLK